MLNKTVVAVLVAGSLFPCAQRPISAGDTGTSTAGRMVSEMAPAPTRSMAGSSSQEQTVEVRLTEYRIEMPLQLRAGRTLFKVTNTGRMFHSLEIEGKGLEQDVESGVDEGQTKTLELDLKPGVYEVYCPVRGHKKAGMSLRVQVS